MQTQKKLLSQLLFKKNNRSRLWLAWISLCTGTALLLLSVMIWWNFRALLYGRQENDSLGNTFLTLSKKVTAENMGRPDLTVFSPEEIRSLEKAPQVQDAGVLTSNRFPAFITLHGRLDFSSEMFLESVPDRFIDKKPKDWNWESGSREVPIILSAEFLNLYNYGFALSQGLPQLSAHSIQSLAFNLVLGSPPQRETYTAKVVGFSDRITSVLVPQNFMEFANKVYGHGAAPHPSRLILSVRDPSDNDFVKYLEEKNYTTNAEQLRWNKIRTVMEIVAGSTGVLALLLMGLSIWVFVLFIELTVARAHTSLVLLLELGYRPSHLKRFMIQKFLPLMFSAVMAALLLAIVVQFMASVFITKMNLQLSVLPGFPVWLVALISVAVLGLQMRQAISKAMKKL